MHENTHPITKALTSLFRAYSSAPDQILFTESFDPPRLLELTVEPAIQDLRIMIGKQGKTIMAIRHVAERMGRRIGLEVKVEIRDNFRGDSEPERRPFQPNPRWGRDNITPLLNDFLSLIYDRHIPVTFENHQEQLYVILDVPNDLTLVKAMGVAFYPFGYRNGRKLSFRVTNYHPNEHNEPEADSVPLPPGMARRLA